jgi:hypothetical protein
MNLCEYLPISSRKYWKVFQLLRKSYISEKLVIEEYYKIILLKGVLICCLILMSI